MTQASFRFVGDHVLTFVNYSDNTNSRLSYRQQARLHNAQRRASEAARGKKPKASASTKGPISSSLMTTRSVSLLDPLSSFARDPFHRIVLESPQAVENVWRSSFSQYYGLPSTDSTPLWFPNPSTAFLSAARVYPDLYRSFILQSVLMTEADHGKANDEAVFANQALIIRDFRSLVGTYDNTLCVNLSRNQFEHIFASAFSLSRNGFHQKSGYDAIIFLNSLFMQVPYNLELNQSPLTEWIRMLMPRPGPSKGRSEAFQLAMLAKVNAVLDFLSSIQDNTHISFAHHVSHYVRPNTAIYQLVNTKLPSHVRSEPFPGFHLICFHRIMSILHRHFNHFSHNPSKGDDVILLRLEATASFCLDYDPPQRIAMFLWALINDAEITGLHHEPDEAVLPWAMKDFVSIHNLSFLQEMVAWFICKCYPQDQIEVPFVDIDDLRTRMQAFYGACEIEP